MYTIAFKSFLQDCFGPVILRLVHQNLTDKFVEPNKALHLTAIALRFMAAGELNRWATTTLSRSTSRLKFSSLVLEESRRQDRQEHSVVFQ